FRDVLLSNAVRKLWNCAGHEKRHGRKPDVPANHDHRTVCIRIHCELERPYGYRQLCPVLGGDGGVMKKIVSVLAFLSVFLTSPAPGAYFADGTLIEQVENTATAGGTTTLVYNSKKHQRFTGSSSQTVVLPSASTMRVGATFVIENDSTGSITVQNNGSSTLATVPAGRTYSFLLAAKPDANGTWSINKAVGEGTIANGDISASAAIDLSKLGTTTAS